MRRFLVASIATLLGVMGFSGVLALSQPPVGASSLPDFTPVNVTVTPNPAQVDFGGQPITVSWTDENIGTGAVTGAPYTDTVYLSSSPDPTNTTAVIAKANVGGGGIAPGGSVPMTEPPPGVNPEITIPGSLASGTYYVIVVDNSTNTFPESNTANNVAVTTLVVTTGLADITPVDLSVSPNPVQVPCGGTAVNVSWTESNIGTGNIPGVNPGPSWIDTIYLSTSPDPTDTAAIITKENVGSYFGDYGIAPGGTLPGRGQVSIPGNLSGGTYYVIVVDNTSNSFPESNYANNVATTQVTLQPLGCGGGALAVQKTGPSEVVDGSQATYTITVTNNGPDQAQGVEVSDPIPAGLSLVSATSTQGTCDATVTCSIGTLDVGATATVTIVTVATQPGPVHNVATATESGSTSTYSSNGVDTQVVPGAGLQLTKSVATPTGPDLLYTLQLVNFGPDPATNAVIKDDLPSNVELIGATWTSGVSGCTGTIVCTVPSLAVGASETVYVTVEALVVAPVTNTASVTADQANPNPSGAQSSVTATALVPDLVITKSHQGDLLAGKDNTYTLTVTNNGTGPTDQPMTVSDDLPTGETFVSGSGEGFSCSASGQLVTCTSSTPLPVGSSEGIALVVAIAPDAPATITNTASVSTPDGAYDPDGTASDTGTVLAPAKIGVTKTADQAVVRVNHKLTYTITVANSGGQPSDDVTLTDQLPAGMTLVSVTPGSPTCTGTATITCDLGVVLPGTSAPTVTIVVIPTQTGSFTNVASAGGVSSNPVGVTVDPPPDLSLTKTVQAPFVQEGSTFSYTLTATNLGPGTATNVAIDDPLPSGIALEAVEPGPGMTCNLSAPPEILNPGPITCTVASLDQGSTAQVVLLVRPLQLGPLSNTAQVTSDDPNPDPNHGTSTANTTVYAYPAGGTFVVGDISPGTTTGTSVTFWGAQWEKDNVLSGGKAPSAFKGFEDSPAQPTCGTSWSTDPGNSTPPPDSVPAYMAVIVSSSITNSGSNISGDTVHVVIVKTDPGYAADPGHAGTGTIVGVLC